MSKGDNTIKGYKLVNSKVKKYGLAFNDLLLFVKISVISVISLTILKMLLRFINIHIGIQYFLILIALIGLIYLVLLYANRSEKQYRINSLMSRFFMQYRKIQITAGKHVKKTKEIS